MSLQSHPLTPDVFLAWATFAAFVLLGLFLIARWTRP